MKIRLLLQVAYAFALMLLTGCMQYRSLMIIDAITLKSQSYQYHRFNSLFISTPTSDDFFVLSPASTCYNLYRCGSKANIIHTDKIPFYTRWPDAIPPAINSFDDKVVFWREESRELCIYDIASGKEDVLAKNISEDSSHLNSIIWINNTNLLVVVEDTHKLLPDRDVETVKIGRVLKINTTNKCIESELNVKDPMACAISPNGRLLAIARMIRGKGIVIIDTETMSLSDELPNTERYSWMKEPSWSTDSTKLAYLDAYSNLSIYDTITKSSTIIYSIPKEQICYFVGMPAKDIVACSYGPSHGLYKTLILIDIPSKKIKFSIKKQFNGSAYVFAGNHIVCEIGY
jgi:hypothetical protein